MMTLHTATIWEIAAGAALIAAAAILTTWNIRRKRPTPDELEFARRMQLTQTGRIVDGTLIDVIEVPDTNGQPCTFLHYAYRIGGVDYECSQDITHMGATLDPAKVRAGFPCSVRYQPGTPQNSIVVAERWSGLRSSLPFYPAHPKSPFVQPHS